MAKSSSAANSIAANSIAVMICLCSSAKAPAAQTSPAASWLTRSLRKGLASVPNHPHFIQL
jgi:hypothetical protein